ncbi:MAG: DUF4261 domain-containing protein [Planctomycetia bacterium]|nr:DUF4261 domain-containing protein [Planctomycetia bacterium]
MSDDLLQRFSGRGVPRIGGPPVANPRLTDPLGLQCLFDEPLELPAEGLALALCDYHAELADASVELFPVPSNQPIGTRGLQPAMLGLLAWGPHVLKLVGFANPMPSAAVESCVRPAHFDPSFKELAYRHQSHVLLYYAGYDHDPLEQYVALAAAAGVLARFGSVVTLNETAHTAIPSAVLLPHEEDAGDMLTALRKLPLPFLYCGFVKLEVEGEPGVWMRTFGAHRFGLTDLAYRATSHDEGTSTFQLFNGMLTYLRASGQSFGPGHTMQVDDDLFLRLRARDETEWYLASEGQMLVAERVPSPESPRNQ